MQQQPSGRLPVIQAYERRPNYEFIYFLVALSLFVIIALLATDSNIFTR